MTDNERESWALKLFEKSPLKQRKLEKLLKYSGDFSAATALDIGSDNGVISLLLRRQGGTWSSADLIPETVESIRGLVGERVFQIDDKALPFDTDSFDLIVIVDFLEHINDDSNVIEEIYRVLKPGGRLVTNVPSPVEGLLRKIRFKCGQTDEAHGHVRSGYSSNSLKSLMTDRFEVQRFETYNRFFAEGVDFLITLALDLLKKQGRGQKGSVITGSDLAKLKKSFKLYSLLYPFLAVALMLDKLLWWQKGNMLIAECRSLKKISKTNND